MKRFTLIELLVVIAIIGVLVTMLMPALAKARTTAMTSVCTTNQKQISIAITNYTISSDDIWPYSPPVEPDLVNGYVSGSKMTAELIWKDAGEIADLYRFAQMILSLRSLLIGLITIANILSQDDRHSYMFNEWSGWLQAWFWIQLTELLRLKILLNGHKCPMAKSQFQMALE